MKFILSKLSPKSIDRIGMYGFFGIAILLCLIVWIGGFYLKRTVNYELGYESMVKETTQSTICEMIKPDARKDFLVNPEVCSK